MERLQPEFITGNLAELEERGRHLASELTDKGFSNDLGERIHRWSDEIITAKCDMTESMGEASRYGKAEIYDDFDYCLAGLISKVSNAVDGCMEIPAVESKSVFEKDPRSSIGYMSNGKCIVDNQTIASHIKIMNEASEKMIGEKCATTFGVFTGKGLPYPLSMLINDTTQCYHRLLDEHKAFMNIKRKTIGKCIIEEEEKRQEYPPYTLISKMEANDDLIEACKEWDKTTEKFYENGLYITGDFDPLKAILFGNKGEFTVGDSIGHRTHLDLDNGTVEYYDGDSIVNETMSKLFGNVGLKCRIRENGVFCDGLKHENVKNVAKRLAGATSMDFRLLQDQTLFPDQKSWWRNSIERIPGMGKRCRITMSEFDPVGVETCLVEEKIRAKEQ